MRFNSPDNLRIIHFGLLWDKFRKEYPNIQHAPPIATAKGEILLDKAIGMPLPRVWFINKHDDQLIQFQVDRFYFNWRKKQRNYPRYDHIIKNFEMTMNTIEIFFSEFKLGDLKPIEYELSYINHIPKGQEWNEFDDISRIFSDFLWGKRQDRFLPIPQNIAWNTRFALPEQKGHLIVNLKKATKIDDEEPLLVFELKTLSNSELTNKESIREWFNLAHEWIVRGFTDLTTSQIQKIWEREDNV
ncbi:MAG: TIGR04255 family protein [Tissierellales bacterium]|nr:TIGR04255 family protein [Tissierellales bacterium]